MESVSRVAPTSNPRTNHSKQPDAPSDPAPWHQSGQKRTKKMSVFKSTLKQNHLKSQLRDGEKRPLLVALAPRRGAGVCGIVPCTLRRGLGPCLQVPSTRATCPFSCQILLQDPGDSPIASTVMGPRLLPPLTCLLQPQPDQVKARGSRAEPSIRGSQAGARAGSHRPGLRLHKNPLEHLAPAFAASLQIDALCQHGLEPSIVAFPIHSLSPYSHSPGSWHAVLPSPLLQQGIPPATHLP
jgi:hypothetical protein